MTKEQINFLKNNSKVVKEIYAEKINQLIIDALNLPKEQRNEMLDAVNILRNWLGEMKMIENQKEFKTENFI